jgi:dGTPase
MTKATRDTLMSNLAPYATHWQKTKGRVMDEAEAFDRTPFQRDRDRLIHSDAFRRLQYKTQVFSNQNAGDLFRTRLTHSLEVAQIARDVCRYLNLDEDLGEVIALAHDLGHAPFGHAGEDALNDCMKPFGGYRHNDQSMKIVRQLERRYGAFDGLNLTWETLEGIAKHNGPMDGEHNPSLYADLEVNTWCGLEGQAAAMADDIAYNHHDMDDGVGMGTLSIEKLRELPQFNRAYEEVVAIYPKLDEYRKVKEIIRRMQSHQIRDLLKTSANNIKKSGVKSADEVRAYGKQLIAFSAKVEKETQELKNFLRENMYRHFQVNRSAFRAHRTINELFDVYMDHCRMLPKHVQDCLAAEPTEHEKAQVVADYIASLTDRSAVQEHARLFGIR